MALDFDPVDTFEDIPAEHIYENEHREFFTLDGVFFMKAASYQAYCAAWCHLISRVGDRDNDLNDAVNYGIIFG